MLLRDGGDAAAADVSSMPEGKRGGPSGNGLRTLRNIADAILACYAAVDRLQRPDPTAGKQPTNLVTDSLESLVAIGGHAMAVDPAIDAVTTRSVNAYRVGMRDDADIASELRAHLALALRNWGLGDVRC